MSYEHGTEHFNLPQTVGSDTRDWFDTNEAFRVVDETLYSANQTVVQATQDIETVKEDISDLKDADTAMTGRVDGIDSRVTANETKIQRLENATADNKQDLMDAICSIEEASATAAYKHDTGDFFWYNDTLYKATANIAIGQQIVPDTNCKTTNITTELLESPSGGVEIDDTVVSATKVWSSYKTNEEIANTGATKTGDTRWYSGKLQYYDGSAWVDAEIGGGSMPTLNYASPLHNFNSDGTSYTAIKDCYLIGSLYSGGSYNDTTITVTIDGTLVFSNNASGTNLTNIIICNAIPCTKIPEGSTVVVSKTTPLLILEEV